MKQKERELLHFLVENKDTFVTSGEIALILSLSERTIRSYIQNMKETIRLNGGEIISKQGHGFQLQITQQLAFDLFLNQSKITRLNQQQVLTEETADRQNYILNKLLLEEATFFLDDLAEQLYVSRSTLTKDLAEMKQLIRPYDLTIESRANKGIWLEGNERDKRHFIMDYFLRSTFINSFQKYMGNNDYFNDVSFEEMTIIILDECREAKIKLSDFILQNLVLHLALSVKRIKAGFSLNHLSINESMIGDLEHLTAEKIIRRLETTSGIQFPPEEVSYLTLHLMAKSNHKQENYTHDDQAVEAELLVVLKALEENHGYPVSTDYLLKNGLLDHLRPLLIRLKQNIRLENPLLKEITENYGDVFQLTKSYLSQMPVLANYEIDDDEWAYLTLHLMAAIEKYNDRRKLQVLVICATGYGSAQLLKNRVIKEFGKHLNVVDVQGYYEIDHQSLTNIDLIISSIDLSTIVFAVPILHVSVFLNENDVSKIRKYVNHRMVNKPQQDLETEDVTSLAQKRQIFDQQLDTNFFKVFPGHVSKDEVLTNLLQLLSEDETEHYVEKMKEQIKHRQTMSSVVFSESIVVPHPATPVGYQTKIAVGMIPEGLVWDTEFTDIKFVFLLSPSVFQNEGITAITKAIVKLIDLPEVQHEILTQKSFIAFKESLIQLI